MLSLMVLIGTRTDFCPAKIVAEVCILTSDASLCEMVTSNASVVGVLREIVRFPAFNFPSGSETGLTETESDGPSLSAITRLADTNPPFSGVVPQLHEEM